MTVDHSFARIILDSVVGIDKPWPQVVAAPATVNMTETQLEAAISLGEQIAKGDVDLWALEEASLKVRGIAPKRKPNTTSVTKKRKRPASNGDGLPTSSVGTDGLSSNKTRKQEAAQSWSTFSLVKPGTNVNEEEAEMIPDIQQIIAQSTSIKPFQRQALTLLTQVPRGRYTTYQAISNAMRKQDSQVQSPNQASGHARAVGMAMRNNPYAPTVPCHRMLSSDGRIGGFHGDWEGEGRFYTEKMRLLREEGVEFDEKGRALGEPFRDFN